MSSERSYGDKLKCADYLFDEIGNIDDAIISESASAKPAVRKKRYAPLLIAACLAFLLIVTLPLLAIGGMLRGLVNDTQFPSSHEENKDALSQLLLDNRENDSVFVCTAEQLDLFDGNAKLIWQYPKSGDYCVMPLTEANLNNLLLSLGNGANVDTVNEPPACRVWITDGSGLTASPYLKASRGNLGYGALIEYDPEIIPDSSVVNLIERLLI